MDQQTQLTADRPPIITAADKDAARLKSFLEVLPMLPTTTTIARVAKELQRHPAWRGPLGQRLGLGYIEDTLRRIRREHTDLIRSRRELRLVGNTAELRIWRRTP